MVSKHVFLNAKKIIEVFPYRGFFKHFWPPLSSDAISIQIRLNSNFKLGICLIWQEKELLKITTLMREVLLVNFKNFRLGVWDSFFCKDIVNNYFQMLQEYMTVWLCHKTVSLFIAHVCLRYSLDKQLQF